MPIQRYRHCCAIALRVMAALLFAPASIAGPLPTGPVTGDAVLLASLARNAPALKPEVLASALQATQCAVRHGTPMPQRLAVIDFSLPSSDKRLWIFDLETGRLLHHELVAHGRGSGEREAQRFSNEANSHRSSLGLFRAHETYHGKHGYSLRLDGLEPGINDRARERAIVIHGADYVSQDWVQAHGRIGRSHGCPAVRQAIASTVVDVLKGGQLVFQYYPDPHWQASSRLLHCDGPQLGALPAATHAG